MQECNQVWVVWSKGWDGEFAIEGLFRSHEKAFRYLIKELGGEIFESLDWKISINNVNYFSTVRHTEKGDDTIRVSLETIQ